MVDATGINLFKGENYEHEFLRKVLSTAPIAIAIYNVENHTIEYSNGVIVYKGISGEEFNRLGFEERMNLLHPDDRDSFIWFSSHLYDMTDDEVRQIEIRCRQGEGEYRWFRANLSPFSRNSDGSIHNVLSCYVDIGEEKLAEESLRRRNDDLRQRDEYRRQQLQSETSERLRTEEELRASELRYRMLFEDSPDSLWEEDFSEVHADLRRLRGEGVVTGDIRAYFSNRPDEVVRLIETIRVIDINRATCRMNETEDKSSLLGKLRLFSVEKNLPIYIEELAAIDENALEFDLPEMSTYTLENNHIYVTIHWMVVAGHEDDWSRVIVSVKDVTQRRLAEMELRSSEERLRGFLEQSNDGVVLVNEDGIVVSCNRAIERMIDLNRADVLGKFAWDARFKNLPALAKDETQREKVRRSLKKFLKTGQAFWINQPHELSIVLEDGTERYVQALMFPIQTRRGYMLGYIVRDVTERTLSDRLLRRRLEMERLIATLSGRFAAIDTGSLDEALGFALRAIAEFFGVDRSYIFLLDENQTKVDKAFEWASPDKPRFVHKWVGESILPFQWVLATLKSMQPLIITDVHQIPENIPEAQILTHYPIKALVFIPLLRGYDLIGALGFQSESEEKNWIEDEEMPLLKVLGEIIVSYLMRKDAENAIYRLLVTLEQRVDERTRELGILYEVAAMAGETLDLDLILHRILEKVLAALACQAATIHLENETGTHVNLSSWINLSDEDVSHISQHGFAPVIIDQLRRFEQPMIVHRRPRGFYPKRKRIPLPLPNYFTFVGVPISAKGKWLGVLSIFEKTINPYTPEQLSLLSTIAGQIGMAVDSARLRQQMEEQAVMEERQRLARELHDSVTQSLYSLTLLSKGWRKQVDQASRQDIGSWFDRVGDITHQTLKEMRLLLYELRPATLEKDGLIGALRRRLDMVEGRVNVRTSLEVEGEIRLNGESEMELYRIIQEALNNALKHARATSVKVSFRRANDTIQVQISDDGKGFDMQSLGSGGLGLSIMRERALKMGYTLDISSLPDSGTNVVVSFPASIH